MKTFAILKMNGFKTNSLGEIEECSEKPSLQDNGDIYTTTISEFLTGKMAIFINSCVHNDNAVECSSFFFLK